MVKIIGILNITPDSFSDGGRYFDQNRALDRAKELIDSGADFVEIGGDSTRPGSQCVGVEEEWRRIEPLVVKLAHRFPIIIDTHHPEIVKKASDFDIKFINDIAATNEEMLKALTLSDVKYIMMYSSSQCAHEFTELENEDPVAAVKSGLQDLLNRLEQSGISKSRIALDPGLGRFLSSNPTVSFTVLDRFEEFARFQLPLVLAASRKGFLRTANERSVVERDIKSAKIGAAIAQRLNNVVPLYIRVHDVVLQRSLLRG